MSGRTRNKRNRVTHFSAPNAEESATIIYQVPTVSTASRRTRQVETTIKNSIIQMTASSTPTSYDQVPEMLPDFDAVHEPVPVHEPGGIVVKVKPKAKRYQNSVHVPPRMNKSM